ncbi:MAG: hypothetical protein V1897_15805 [Pseudomonadota bacterium]
MEEEILVNPDISAEYRTFEELVAENSGHELDYLELVSRDPLSMDSATLAFSLSRFMRLSGPLMEKLLLSLGEEDSPGLKEIFQSKGVELDKNQAQKLRNIFISFRDSKDSEAGLNLVKALQVMTIARQRQRVTLNLGESYKTPNEGWIEEDFGGDEGAREMVRAIEDPHWDEREE